MANEQQNKIISLWWLRWFLVVILVLGIILCSGYLPVPWQDHFYLLSGRIRSDSCGKLIGIWLISIAVTHFVIYSAARGMGRLFALRRPDRIPDLWSPALLGISESLLYPGAILAGKSEFIGVWLAIKVAGNWIQWSGSSDPKNPESAYEGRRRFNRFLVGNALSILAAFVTYMAWKIWALI
jgi:hypothetical protein